MHRKLQGNASSVDLSAPQELRGKSSELRRRRCIAASWARFSPTVRTLVSVYFVISFDQQPKKHQGPGWGHGYHTHILIQRLVDDGLDL